MTKLREIMRPGFVVAVPEGATIVEAAQAMMDRNVGMVAVLDGDRLVGLFSERDVVRRIVGVGRDPNATPVSQVMTTLSPGCTSWTSSIVLRAARATSNDR